MPAAGDGIGWVMLGVGGGAALGAWLRWALGSALNALWHGFPLGTLAANWLGCFLFGGVLALPNLEGALRTVLVTGFLGGLTTFSSFSAEGFALLQRGQWAMLGAQLAAHVLGGWLAVWAGWRVLSRVLG